MKNYKIHLLNFIFILCFALHFSEAQNTVTVDDMAGGIEEYCKGLGYENFPNCSVTDTLNKILYVSGNIKKDGLFQVLKWDGKTWAQCGTGIYGAPNSLIMYKGELYVAGRFTKAADVEVKNLAKWDGKKWCSVEGPKGFSLPFITSMCIYQNELYFGGWFSTGSKEEREESSSKKKVKFAKWDGQKWDNLGENYSDDAGGINALCVYKDELVVGGSFGTICGNEIDALAFYNGSTWRSGGLKMKTGFWTGGGSGSFGLNCMEVFKGELYLGGSFNIGGMDGLCRWDGNSFKPVSEGEGKGKGWIKLNVTGSKISDMVVYKNELVIIGVFKANGDVNNITCWDGEKFVKRFHLVQAFPETACVYDKGVYIGGLITKVVPILPNGENGEKVKLKFSAHIKY